ncbi:hypothetical protein Micbo1qcDRAFT_167222 [Microdochium bolleyi]|uniref:Uncharacterized protein n=1 Tax=Microdochium bolleyi TaxID=196109 RepID=A0A136IRT0_9PEZI|nr:hypothetical protein Micbo1qcDRAFT_167222 [Microdochium bolleyi]
MRASHFLISLQYQATEAIPDFYVIHLVTTNGSLGFERDYARRLVLRTVAPTSTLGTIRTTYHELGLQISHAWRNTEHFFDIFRHGGLGFLPRCSVRSLFPQYD